MIIAVSWCITRLIVLTNTYITVLIITVYNIDVNFKNKTLDHYG